ncbi:glycosyltransferase family protein [Motiliproteus sp. MSK22-1]|uniref:glycosyltransferase family protein n=1 Tax=Motiliproteus sp. MSK22-1 TaxID=1897630 RepID=UPI001E437B20|nr:glycosyltransferase [Motiliproteus sp. MSK22-1]
MTEFSMPGKLENARVLMYSHDTFGLGHLRRCRALAHSLVEQFKGLSVLILTGSPIIGRFEFKVRVDFVRIPGVIKLRNGDYTSLGLHINLEHTLAMRESIILHTAEIFDPDLFIVDKEPLGLKGEVESTLKMLKRKGKPVVLGLRDVLDAPRLLREEWATKNAIPALEQYYDELWVYGDISMGDPLAGLDIPETIKNKQHYTGYLPRALPEKVQSKHLADIPHPYLLVTPGGGGDGVEMVEWVLSAYESAGDLPWHGLFVVGPFMSLANQENFKERIDRLDNASLITFDNHMESLMDHAAGVVAMGGYNTFCEILSFNKRALIIPRTTPREEQLIRAQNAAQLNLVKLLDPRGGIDNHRMVEALKSLAQQEKPSEVMPKGFLRGLETVNERFIDIIRTYN